ncbi:MAG: methylenetetrahydrofolate reductase [Gammaproteobacteria bacterium]
MNARVAPLGVQDMKSRVVEFARAASTEISTMDEKTVPELVGVLPKGITIYVAHTPKASLDDVVRVAIQVQQLGFRASPHIVARRLESERALRTALGQLTEAGVEQVLLVAGDPPNPPAYKSTLEVIATGAIEQSGIKVASVAGHPEGHKHVDDAELLAALKYKQAWSERTGVKAQIATQFSFDADINCRWAKSLEQQGVTMPISIGVAGPTPITKLIKYAVACGVGASLNKVMGNLTAMANLARMAVGADQMMVAMLRGCEQHGVARIVRPHIFAFGGVLSTAKWLRQVQDGQFEIGENDKFEMAST